MTLVAEQKGSSGGRVSSLSLAVLRVAAVRPRHLPPDRFGAAGSSHCASRAAAFLADITVN
jgi:hypothetical protein